YHRALLEAGIYVGGNALDAPETATTVRLRDNKRQIQDGPYADTKELLGGFVVLELPSLDAALEWAARCPAASYGAVELRPLATDIDQRVIVDNPN
ncbi:MAG: YciI family protein, partial [Steroidobacteraceae bacterium]